MPESEEVTILELDEAHAKALRDHLTEAWASKPGIDRLSEDVLAALEDIDVPDEGV